MLAYPRLCKTLEFLVERGPVYGRTRLVKLVYLSDRLWFKQRGEVYTEAKYFRWNHGPFAREILSAIDWMDGVELIQNEISSTNGLTYRYETGQRTRLREVVLHREFEEIVQGVAQRWRSASLQSLLDYVYARPDFRESGFGDRLLQPA